MKTFKINKDFEIICEWKKTRNGFKHEAVLLENGNEIDRTKICYLNRTWERFDFESVIRKLLDKTEILKGKKKDNFMDRIFGIETGEISRQFKTISAVAKMGEVICSGNKKAENDWKTRILKAGLEKQGLIMPDNWDQLDEKEKEKRLNGVLGVLAG
jgi:hypothetical protein